MSELEFQKSLYDSVLLTISEKLSVYTRESFAIKHGLSQEELEFIDRVLFSCSVSGDVSYSNFKNLILERINKFKSDLVFEQLLISYKEYLPVSEKILQSKSREER